ncbi:MAG: tetratricopeptide repeat protein, partial [Alphaproteobacteria bacterium]
MTKTAIFISHASKGKDGKWAKKIYMCLKAKGYDVFLSSKDIKAGTPKSIEIIRENLKKSDVCLALISKKFNQSAACQQEIGYAVGAEEIKIIPLLWSDGKNDPKPEFFIQQHQAISWQDKDFCDKLLEAIKENNYIPNKYRQKILQADTLEKKLELYNEFIKNNDKNSQAYFERAFIKIRLNQYKEAIKDYDKVIELNPDLAIAYNNRGNTIQHLQEYEKAIEDYDKAIKLNPTYFESYNNRGSANALLERYNEAMKDFNEAIKLNPNFANTYYNRGNANASLKQYESAIKDYGKAIELNPTDAPIYNNRGSAKVHLKKYKDAIKDFDKAIELDPNFANTYYNRGNANASLKQYESAIK